MQLYAREPMGVDLDQSLYALDSTTIDLCLSLFPWAKFRRHKASLYQILQILSLTLFVITPILQPLQATDSQSDLYNSSNQLILFSF